MSNAPQTLLTVDEFLASAPEGEGKWELHDGRPVCMAPERVAHGLTKVSAYLALAAAIRRAGLPCQALPDSVGIRLSARSLFIPDASVYCGPRIRLDAREIPAPVIVVEVLSPSTAPYDQVDKLAYFSLPSVMHYLILNPDTRRGVHHRRGGGGGIETSILREGTLRLDPPGIEVEAAELFGAD